MQHTRVGQTYLLGPNTISDPVLYYQPTFTNRGSFYQSGYNGQQALVLGDTATFDEHWSALVAASQTWLRAASYSAKGATTAEYDKDGISPTVSVIYKPMTNSTVYFTYADALQQGDTAPATGVANPGVVLAPYRSQDFELGGKITLDQRLDLGLTLFHMVRPYAFIDPADDTFKSSGDQINDGIEVTAKGNVLDNLTLFGGVTYIDPELVGTANPTTSNKLVISVPKWQGNVYLEYRPPEVNGFAVDLDVHYAGKRAADVTNTTWADSYTTLDIGARYTTSVYQTEVTVRFGIDNVTDTHYWAAILPSAQNGTSANYAAFFGAPRIVHTSVSVDF